METILRYRRRSLVSHLFLIVTLYTSLQVVTTILPLSLEPPVPEVWVGCRALSLVARTARVRTPSVTANSAPAPTPPAPPCPLQWATLSDSNQRLILVGSDPNLCPADSNSISQLPLSLLLQPSTRHCRLVTPTSMAVSVGCPGSSTEGVWLGAECTRASTQASRSPLLQARHLPASSRIRRPTETGSDNDNLAIYRFDD